MIMIGEDEESEESEESEAGEEGEEGEEVLPEEPEKRLSIHEDAGRLSRFEVIISPAREAQGARKTFIFGMFSVWRMQVT